MSATLADMPTADYDTILQALEARLRSDAGKFVPSPFDKWSSAPANPTRNELLTAMTFYRGCQEAFSGALATAQSALNIWDVAAARDHNDVQPISRLPVELVRHVFDHFFGETPIYDMDDPPTFLWTFHHWRSVALSYPVLWSDIFIDYCGRFRREPTFFRFRRPFTPFCIERLKEHIRRSQNAPLNVVISIEALNSGGNEKLYLNEMVRALYAQSARFESIYIIVNADTKDTCILPLPRSLPNLNGLTVDATRAAVVLEDDVEVRPSYVSLEGRALSSIRLIDSQRLQRLVLRCAEGFQYVEALHDLLKRADVLQELTLELDNREGEQPIVFDDVPLIPSLKQLQLGCDPQAFKYVFDPSSVAHLKAYVPGSAFNGFTSFIHKMRDLQSLRLLEWRWRQRKPDIDTWLAGKSKLIVASLGRKAFLDVDPSILAPTNAPSLKYIIVDARVDGHILRKAARVLDISPQVRIVIGVHIPPNLRVRFLTPEHLLRVKRNRSNLSLKDVCDAHNSGIGEVFEPYVDSESYEGSSEENASNHPSGFSDDDSMDDIIVGLF